MNELVRKIRTFLSDPRHAILSKLAPFRHRAAERYFRENNLQTLLATTDKDEIKAEFWDLVYLHKTILLRKPQTVLEFGCGFSTIVMADAIKRNGSGRLYTVDTSERWLENTRTKLGALAEMVDLRHSPASLHVHAAQLVSYYDKLPNIVPDMIYLDGPDPRTVTGSFNGIAFGTEDGANRSVIAADILLYETSLNPGCTVIVDGRKYNVEFLQTNLRRNWAIAHDRTMKHTVMRLDRRF